ncbi:MAG: hypothetical protein J6A78_00345 [Clostridia bacterium]|nr:hypothetical protein [Clostridia bacterium]
MKKLLAFLLTFTLLFTFAACGGKNTTTDSKPNKTDNTFSKPEGYVTVVKVTINPEFNLYLDESNKVLAIEALNDDAKKVKEKLRHKENDLDAVIKEVISATYAEGFVKENAFVKVSLAEVKDEKVNTEEILSSTEAAIKQKATELKITVTVETKEEAVTPEDTESDISKDEPEKTPAKSYTYHLFMTDTFKDDGSLHFDVLARDCIQFFSDKKYLKSEVDGIEFNYEIPEKVIYDKINSKFVITDKIWNDFKAKGSYDLEGPERASYKNGIFYYTRYDSWGGGEPITYSIYDNHDNKKGTIEITYQITPAESNPYRMRVVYQYDKKFAGTKYEFIKPCDDFYFGAIKSENKDFINSIKIAKVIESPTQNLSYTYNGISINFYLYESNPTQLVCYGFSGGTPEFDCDCSKAEDITLKKWNYNSQTKEARCTCGGTVLKDPLIGEVFW